MIWRDRSAPLESLGKTTLGGWDARAQELGGWTISSHHAYDFNERVVHLGSGGRIAARRLGAVVTRVAGTGDDGFDGEGSPAIGAHLNTPQGIALAADGSIYIADTGCWRL